MSSALCTSIYYAAIGPMLRRLSGDPRPHNLRALLLRSQSLNSYPGFPQSENCLKDVRANCFCAFFVSTKIHSKMSNDRTDGHCYNRLLAVCFSFDI